MRFSYVSTTFIHYLKNNTGRARFHGREGWECVPIEANTYERKPRDWETGAKESNIENF